MEPSHTLWLKHPRQQGATLIKPPKGTEDNVGSGSALIPMELPGHANREVVIDERQGLRLIEEQGAWRSQGFQALLEKCGEK